MSDNKKKRVDEGFVPQKSPKRSVKLEKGFVPPRLPKKPPAIPANKKK
jgi:hypothetical protein